MIVVCVVMEFLPYENILLMNCVTFTESLGKRCQQMGKLIVAVDIGRIFLHRILYLQYSGILTCLGVEYAYTIYILNREIDVLEYLLALTACTKGIYRDCHACEYSHKCQYYV